MKKRIVLKAVETLQKRIEDAKKASEQDPYVDAYAMQKTLIQELIDILKSNTDSLIDSQLQHWIDRQEYAGKEANGKVLLQESIEALDSILEKESQTEQISIYDLPEVKGENWNE